MIHKLCLAVYPHKDMKWDILKEYLKKGKQFGFEEIFTSIHLPEYTMEEQLQFLLTLSAYGHEAGMEISVDVGGKTLFSCMESQAYTTLLKRAKIDYLRLDYGYEREIMDKVAETIGIQSFVLNASIMRDTDVIEWLALAKQKGYHIRACHNYYPRKETGLYEAFMKQQYAIFHAYQIPVMGCVASFTKPRGPLKEGLPTMEEQRYCGIEKAALEIERLQVCDEIMAADEELSEEEFTSLYRILKKEPMILHVKLLPTTTEQEKRLLFRTSHEIRYDSNAFVLRSRSSRQMAEFSEAIAPHTCIERKALSITIDNISYLRYSGEIQFVLQDLPMDDRVNVIGYVQKEDAWKLAYAKEGYTYQLEEC